MAEYVCLGHASTPYLRAYYTDDFSAPTTFASYDAAVYGVHASYDGAWLAAAGNSTTQGKIAVWNTSNWSQITITNQPTYLARDVHFSSDAAYLAMASQNSGDLTMCFRVYDTSDWSWHKSNYSFPNNSIRKIRWSHDDAYIAIIYGASPYLRIIQVSDWSTVTLDSGLSLPSSLRYIEWSNDDSLIAIGSTGTPYVTFIDTSDWSDASIDLTSLLPSTIYSVEGVAWNADDSYCAMVHDDANYATVFDTSDWSKVTTTSVGGHLDQVNFNAAEDLLIVSGNTSGYYLDALDTSDWSLVTGMPTSSSTQAQCILNTPVYNQLYLTHNFSPDVSWGFAPDTFQGIAIIEGGTKYSSGCYDGTAVRIFMQIGDKYYDYETLDPQGTECQVIGFAPGNKELWHGGGTPNYIGWSDRSADRHWGEFSSYAWGATLLGSQPTSLGWSDNGLYRVGTYHDIYEHRPFFWYWDGDSWEKWDYSIQEKIDHPDEMLESLAHWHRVSISPDGQYIAQSTTSGVTYANTPYFFINYNDGTKFFTPMDIDFDTYTFTNSDGFHIDWSPDSTTIVAYAKAFQYNGTSEQWEIEAVLSHDWLYRVAWHPDSTYVACHIGATVNIYSVSGSTFTLITPAPFSAFSGAVTAVRYSKCGNYFFVGTAPATGNAFFMYDVSGSTFTLNTDTDWSDIVDDVVQIEVCDIPFEADVGAFSLEAEIGETGTAFHNGLLHDAGSPLQMTYSIAGQSSLYTTQPFPLVAQFKDTISFQVGVNAGAFSLVPAVLGDEVPATTAGILTTTYSITGALPLTYDLFDLINAERVLNGLDPYVRNTKLAAASEVGVAEMVATESGTYTSSVADLIHNAGYVYITAGAIPTKLDESFTAQELFDAWMDSPAVEAYILHETMEDIGIATDNYNGNNYVSVIMALWHPQYQVVDVPTITMEYSLPTSPFFDFLSAESYATFLANSASPYLPKYAAKIGDYYIPSLISFTYRLSNSKPSRVELNFVYTPEVLSELETRIEDGISVESVIDYKGATVRNVVMSASIENVAFAGKESPVITLSGFNNLNYYQSTLALQNVMTKTIDEDGKIRFRCQTPDFYLRPGATVTYGSDSIVIGEVVVFVRDGLNQYMEIKEE